jgi:hypothetical protein
LFGTGKITFRAQRKAASMRKTLPQLCVLALAVPAKSLTEQVAQVSFQDAAHSQAASQVHRFFNLFTKETVMAKIRYWTDPQLIIVGRRYGGDDVALEAGEAFARWQRDLPALAGYGYGQGALDAFAVLKNGSQNRIFTIRYIHTNGGCRWGKNVSHCGSDRLFQRKTDSKTC